MSDHLLPPNATPLERALAGTMARISAIPVLVRQSRDPDTCPLALLPWLAWACSVDEWDPAWTEEAKREVVRSSFNLHRRKGTIGSVKRALFLTGFADGVLLEGVAHGMHWAEYKVTFDRLLTIAEVQYSKRALEATAPARSVLVSFDFTSAALLHDDTAYYDGTYSHGEI